MIIGANVLLPAGTEARAFRFLALCLVGWIGVRALALWDAAVPMAAPAGVGSAWVPPPPALAAPLPPFVTSARAGDRPLARQALGMSVPPSMLASRQGARRAFAVGDDDRRGEDRSLVGGGNRHSLRLALMARLFPSASQSSAAFPGRESLWAAAAPAAAATPGYAEPFWMNRRLGGWSLGSWVYLREGSDRTPGNIVAGGQLGGSQAGMRLAYGFGDAGRVRAYGRATVAIEQPRQREAAFGVAFAPVRRWPVDIAVEQRVALGDQGRTALAALASGGVGDVPVAGAFRLEAYAQIGVVGLNRRDGFADGAVVIDRRLGKDERSPLRLGALAAGAIQPGASRVDIGPRLTVKLPDVGQGARIALDWRQRVAGNARPESGVALTLAADF